MRRADFQRLKTAVLRWGEPDYVPLFEFHVADQIMSAILGKQVHDPGRIGITLTAPPIEQALKFVPNYVQFYAAAGYDFVPIKFGVGPQILKIVETQRVKPERIRAQTVVEGHPLSWGNEGMGFLATWADFEAFPWPEPGTSEMRVFDAAAAVLPNGMRLIAHGGGMLAHARNYMGMERFWTAIHEEPDLVRAILCRLQELELSAIDQATDHLAVAALLLDDDLGHTAALMENPTFLRQDVFPFYRRVGQLLGAKDLPFLMHSCGNVRDVLDDLIACGVDALHPIQPGAMDIVQIKKDVGRKISLMGNIDLDGVLCRGTFQQVRADVRGHVRDLAPGGGYVISSSSSIPDYVPAENYRAFLAACLEMGKYPIDVQQV